MTLLSATNSIRRVFAMREAPWTAAACCRFGRAQPAARGRRPQQAAGRKAAAGCRSPRRCARLLRAVIAIVFGVFLIRAAAAPPPDAAMAAALKYLAAQQQPDGSFGGPQPHLKAAFAILAALSTSERGTPGLAGRAAAYLVKDANASGFLGDEAFPIESHSVVLTALVSAHSRLAGAEARTEAGERIQRGLRHLLQLQDRSSAAAARGGWSMEAKPGRPNDRRATGWALLALRTARAHGLEVPQANVERATNFLLGSFKAQADNASQIGGFSVDTEGLAVELMSALGGWVLATSPAKEDWRRMNLAWLTRHPPAWTGPNYFYSGFFRLRALKFSNASEALAAEQSQRLFTQIADHQKADGSILFPPGNAQNTITMGPVFSTAMAVLILNTGESRLAADEDFRLRPLF